ncbi:MAG: hypothetical protein GY797_08865 [Deltaproteobacteria bacterium]|nr:hypothetical protein [Deltaproteobacteria bacterium]
MAGYISTKLMTVELPIEKKLFSRANPWPRTPWEAGSFIDGWIKTRWWSFRD